MCGLQGRVVEEALRRLAEERIEERHLLVSCTEQARRLLSHCLCLCLCLPPTLRSPGLCIIRRLSLCLALPLLPLRLTGFLSMLTVANSDFRSMAFYSRPSWS